MDEDWAPTSEGEGSGTGEDGEEPLVCKLVNTIIMLFTY
jgi:hypothetical protein